MYIYLEIHKCGDEEEYSLLVYSESGWLVKTLGPTRRKVASEQGG
jgi:hypothetical protein